MINNIDIINLSKKRPNKALSVINAILAVFIIIMVIAIVVLTFFISPMTISGESMNPTLHNEQKIFISKTAYQLTYGDIVVFKIPENEKSPIKRIIAMSGDTISFDVAKKAWCRNGVQLTESYNDIGKIDNVSEYFLSTDSNLLELLTTTGLKLKQNELFVLGDNRTISYDSHCYGAIKEDWIIGKML